jgi:poly(3-hydroxyalkanoate) synthetase
VNGLRSFQRDMTSQPRVPAMVEPDAFAMGENLATTPRSVVLKTRMFELIRYAPQNPTVARIPLLAISVASVTPHLTEVSGIKPATVHRGVRSVSPVALA